MSNYSPYVIQKLPSWTEQHQSDEEKCEALAAQLALARRLLTQERAATETAEKLLFEHELNFQTHQKSQRE
jgi:hypothetical protein